MNEFVVVCPSATLDSFMDIIIRDGFLVVMKRDEYKGVVTLRDTVIHEGRVAEDFMRRRPLVFIGNRIKDVFKTMETEGWSVLPVFNKTDFIGIISYRYLVKTLLNDSDGKRIYPAKDALTEKVKKEHECEFQFSECPDCDASSEDYPSIWNKFIGLSETAEKIRRQIVKASGSNYPLLLTGETGTGKNVVAELVHQNSEFSRKSFVMVNMASTPESLFESEFFGYEKGAFTGAMRRKKGLVELAEGGTLFIDEIGEMAIANQAKLLHFLDTKVFRRLGGEEMRMSDLRIIAATNRNLEELIKEGNFRKDLYFRLNVLRIHLPPLRERRRDIRPIAESFITKDFLNCNFDSYFEEDFFQRIESYGWPGNIRELQNVIWRTLSILNEGETLKACHLPKFISRSVDLQASNTDSNETRKLQDEQKVYIKKVLEKTGGNKSEAARKLGISRSTLRRKLRSF
ncbi:MAG: sigma-54 interaction domain-containing protein [Fibrobacterota bacterium]